MGSDDIPPPVTDPDWEQWAERQLGDVEFDTELGRKMAADARRIASGDLSKAEFHERYSEAVEAEFGVDERPTKKHVTPDDRDPTAPLPGIPDERAESRRTILKALGGFAAAAGTASFAGYLGGVASEDINDSNETLVGENGDIVDEDERDTQMGMVIDTERCIACLQCSEACKVENNTDVGVHWPYVFRYQDEHAGDTREDFLTRHCQHCSEPSCTYVCPTQARFQREDDGIVLTDYQTCVGCKYCQVACPYGVNYLGKDNPNPNVMQMRNDRHELEVTDADDDTDEPANGIRFGSDEDGITFGSDEGITFDSDDPRLEPGQLPRFDRETKNGVEAAGNPPRGVMGKCTFCIHRQDRDEDDPLQGTTACEQHCPVDAIHFGDMNDPESDPREHLREKQESNQYRLLDEVGNEPNIIYVGRKPSKDATPIEGPVAYEDRGMKDGDYDYEEVITETEEQEEQEEQEEEVES